jgi:hypothetical protein
MAGTSEGRGGPGGLYQQLAPNAPIVIPVLDGRQYRLVAHVERRSGHSCGRSIRYQGHCLAIVRVGDLDFTIRGSGAPDVNVTPRGSVSVRMRGRY